MTETLYECSKCGNYFPESGIEVVVIKEWIAQWGRWSDEKKRALCSHCRAVATTPPNWYYGDWAWPYRTNPIQPTIVWNDAGPSGSVQ